MLDHLTIRLPQLPPSLEGLRLLQLTDLHVRSERRWHGRLLDHISRLGPDLLLITGDLADPGGERICHKLLGEAMEAARPRLGAAGVFGNHDEPGLRRALSSLPIHWLCDDAWALPDVPLTLLGVDCDTRARNGDLMAAVLREPVEPAGEPRLRLLLAHLPTWLAAAADCGVPLTITGHTHGGQIRLPTGHALVNAVDWPLHLTSGLLQLKSSYCLVSRGLGDGLADGLRLFCPPQAPVITLSARSEPLTPCQRITKVRRW